MVDIAGGSPYFIKLAQKSARHCEAPVESAARWLSMAREDPVERTLMIVKPDAVGRNVIGEILRRVESEGFVVRELRMTRLDREEARAFYAVHRERPFYDELVDFMVSGPVVPMVLERDDAVAHLREFIGQTDSTKAAPGTIRRDFGTDVQCNAVHASDSLENAEREIGFYFGKEA